jgi:mono/diheme cytochrome c family protein
MGEAWEEALVWVMPPEMEHRLIGGKGGGTLPQGLEKGSQTMKPQFVLLAAVGTLALAACQPDTPVQSATAAEPQPSRAELAQTDADGVPMLVGAVCGSCHAVTPGTLSPLPQAPTFPEIANRDGLTRETLTAYLRDAHNYPDIMDVGLTDADVALVTDYMLSLKDPDYRRPPS